MPHQTVEKVTKHAEFSQTQHIDKVVDVLVVMQRKVPRIQTGLKTVEVPINQVAEHAESPQTLYIDKVVVEMLVVMRRKVIQIQSVLKTVESPPAQFVGRVVEAPVIMQMRQCRLSRRRIPLRHAPFIGIPNVPRKKR